MQRGESILAATSTRCREESKYLQQQVQDAERRVNTQYNNKYKMQRGESIHAATSTRCTEESRYSLQQIQDVESRVNTGYKKYKM